MNLLIKKTILISLFLCSFLLVKSEIKKDKIDSLTRSQRILPIYDVRQYGAIGDGKTINTKAFQTAIDQCNISGGGVVLVTGGSYVIGTIFLKSNICLRIESGAIILGSRNTKDYSTNTDRTMYRGEPFMDRCLIFADHAENISIEGSGIIDGQGKYFPETGDLQSNRPKLMRLLKCSHIRVRDITLRSPASWTTEWRYCNDIVVTGVTIFSRANSNGDGLDFDGCSNVRVSNCSFDTSDDSICLQTSLIAKPCFNIVITNCIFSSHWSGIRIGLLSRGDFENVLVTNCIFNDHNDSGLKIQMCEGGEMKNMIFSNLIMKNVPRPVFMTFTQQNAWVDANNEVRPMKKMNNFQFNNIIVESDSGGKDCSFIITGLPGHPIENVTLSNIRATFPGGGTAVDAKNVLAELTKGNLKGEWPEYKVLGKTVPSFGLYLRHVKGLTLHDVELTTVEKDARPSIVLIDVTKSKIKRIYK